MKQTSFASLKYAGREVTLPRETYLLLSGQIQARRTEVTKSTRARYTLEFKLEAVRMVKGGQSLAVGIDKQQHAP